MKGIAKEYQVEWDTAESEKQLLKPPDVLITLRFNNIGANNLPVKPSTTAQFMETHKPTSRHQRGNVEFEDSKKASAEAAVESAMKAVAAAEVAA
ncbi:hypothetical protein K1719_045699 [Acacia pycnantha]|nr:hypothetical protein K1719_045699 [Acacia pycnantha]